jgi:hypothetical protein
MVHDVRVPVANVGSSSNPACATCPIVATAEARSLLLGHHSSDGTAAVGYLPVATEDYGLLLQRRIVVVVLELWPRCPTEGSGSQYPPESGGGHIEVYPAMGDPPHDIIGVGPI